MRHEKKIYNDNDWICSKCSNDNFSWREKCNKCDAPKDGGRSERPRRGRDSGRSERPRGKSEKREWGKSERPRRGRDSGRSERPRRGRDSGRSERPRGERDSGRSERPRGKSEKREWGKSERPRDKAEKGNRGPKRLRGKSRSHFKNRELDDIFKRKEE